LIVIPGANVPYHLDLSARRRITWKPRSAFSPREVRHDFEQASRTICCRHRHCTQRIVKQAGPAPDRNRTLVEIFSLPLGIVFSFFRHKNGLLVIGSGLCAPGPWESSVTSLQAAGRSKARPLRTGNLSNLSHRFKPSTTHAAFEFRSPGRRLWGVSASGEVFLHDALLQAPADHMNRR